MSEGELRDKPFVTLSGRRCEAVMTALSRGHNGVVAEGG